MIYRKSLVFQKSNSEKLYLLRRQMRAPGSLKNTWHFGQERLLKCSYLVLWSQVALSLPIGNGISKLSMKIKILISSFVRTLRVLDLAQPSSLQSRGTSIRESKFHCTFFAPFSIQSDCAQRYLIPSTLARPFWATALVPCHSISLHTSPWLFKNTVVTASL